MGNVGFFEVCVDEFDRAQRFYRAVAGWEFTKSERMPYEYYMIAAGAKEQIGLWQGGMRKRAKPISSEGGESGYVCHIIVDGIDEALERVARNGGRVTGPKIRIPAGQIAQAVDTEGNTLAIWEMAR